MACARDANAWRFNLYIVRWGKNVHNVHKWRHNGPMAFVPSVKKFIQLTGSPGQDDQRSERMTATITMTTSAGSLAMPDSVSCVHVSRVSPKHL